MSVATAETTIVLSLVAHTNVGKTTLARTLLRRDVGEVRDMAHVTEVAEAYDLVEAGTARLVLEDTPGFGDTPRLMKRLRAQGNPIGWFLHTVWDRRRDRPLWCAQEAVRSAKERADAVLYLVNAAEAPEDAGYLGPEMELLAWIGKPTLLLLNQTGVASGDDLTAAWRAFASGHPIVREVLPLDAFTRCWVEERGLLGRVAAVLPPEKRPAMDAVLAAFEARLLAAHGRCVEGMADHLARAAADRVPLPVKAGQGEKRKAMQALAERLERSTKDLMRTLIAEHGLDGSSAARIEESLGDFVVRGAKEADPKRGGLLGAIVGGAVSGLAADLATGGLTFGGGAVLGALLGALTGAGLAKAYTMAGSGTSPSVTWTTEALARVARATLARYLAVAHYGRGRGGWQDLDLPPAWDAKVLETYALHAPAIEHALRTMSNAGAVPDPERRVLAAALDRWTKDALKGLYPEAAAWLP